MKDDKSTLVDTVEAIGSSPQWPPTPRLAKPGKNIHLPHREKEVQGRRTGGMNSTCTSWWMDSWMATTTARSVVFFIYICSMLSLVSSFTYTVHILLQEQKLFAEF